MVSLLLEKDANPNAPDVNAQTPLHYAAFARNPSIARSLIANGASIEVADNEGLTPFVVAKRNGNLKVLSLLKLPQEEVVLSDGLESLARATAPLQTEESTKLQVQRLLREASRGVPLVQLAVSLGSETAVRQLLESDPNALAQRDPYGFLPIHLAAESGDPVVLGLILARGTGINDEQNSAQWTPLHFAASSGNKDAARALLEHGANRAAVDALGRTPADLAEMLGHGELAFLLH
jgi:ankyrin repeat protein